MPAGMAFNMGKIEPLADRDLQDPSSQDGHLDLPTKPY